MRLTHRCIVITGAAGGLGAGMARALAGRGANLALFDIDRTALNALADELSDTSAKVAVFHADVRSLESLVSAFAAAADYFGGIDIVVAGAGIDRMAPLADQSAADFEATIDINLVGVWRTFRAALPYVRQRQGYLLAVSSMAAFVASPLQGSYAASKAGVWALCNSLRLEEAGNGVAVGSLHPTFFHTPLFDTMVATHAGRQVWNGNRGLWKPVPIDRVIAGALRAMQKRAQITVVPRFQGPVALMAGLFRRPLEILGFPQKRIDRALAAYRANDDKPTG